MMLLYETPAGFALLSSSSTQSKSDINTVDNLQFKVKAFSKFASTAEAVEAMATLADGKMSDQLKSFLKQNLPTSSKQEDEKKSSKKERKEENDKDMTLMVADSKLGAHIHKKLGIPVVADWESIGEVFRQARECIYELLDVPMNDINSMTLGLAHSLARHQIKFSPDQADTMIVQAINLLDELDKELNIYCMRLREWYGWHFPELSKLISDHALFAKLVFHVGYRTSFVSFTQWVDLGTEITDDLVQNLKSAAEISMGTDIGEEDLVNMQSLAKQVMDSFEYRADLYNYLVDRMNAIAPNLTEMVGELVGARLIAHAGSLLNLAKAPASTLQILGAEKALFRALKAKHDTPKYGLIYHASLVGQASSKLKGKMARTLAAKTSLAVRTDAFSIAKDDASKDSKHSMGAANRLKVEERLRQLENVKRNTLVGDAKAPKAFSKIPNVGTVKVPFGKQATFSSFSIPTSNKKRKAEENSNQNGNGDDGDAKKANLSPSQ